MDCRVASLLAMTTDLQVLIHFSKSERAPKHLAARSARGDAQTFAP
jgi:hypothetical protein